MPYFENPQAWMPNQDVVAGMTLTRLDSFFAVLAPENQSVIASYEDYQALLAARIAWMIQQWSADQEMPMAAVDSMIRHQLTKDQVPNFAMPSPHQATPESWGQAIAQSPWMSTIWTLEVAPEPEDYPLAMAQGENRQDAIATVEEQTLEEWLLFFGKQG
jgi:hypothetical protein